MACPSINAYLARLGYTRFEGNTGLCPAKIELLTHLSRNCKTALEIGFNAGHSADTILRANPNIKLTSFDLGEHPYVAPAHHYIHFLHPNRHRLIVGDSTKTLPAFIKQFPNERFDLLFIDGGHSYETALSDLNCCLTLAHKDSVIVMDDTIYVPNWEKDYSIGPTTVWKEAVANEFIRDDVRLTMDQWNGISYGYINTETLSSKAVPTPPASPQPEDC